VVGSHLYVFGGIDNSTTDQRQTYVYDPASNSWSSAPDMAQTRMLPGGASVGNSIVAVGGSNGSSLLTSAEAATVSCQAAPPAPPATDTPTPAATPLSRS
jgi:Kelch motif